MRRSRLVAVAAVAVFTMVGAGCGGDDDSSDSSDDSVSSSDDGDSDDTDSPEAEPSDAETDPADEPSDDPTDEKDKPSEGEEDAGAPLEPQTVVDACQDATDGGTWPAVGEVDIQPDGEGVLAKAEVDLGGKPVMFFCSVIGTNDNPEVKANSPLS